MIFFPAIDLKEGQCVRLVRGDMRQATVFNTDPAAQARIFMEAGCEWLHVVDLDGAVLGRPVNTDSVVSILEAVDIPVQLGGGIRDLETVAHWLNSGVRRVILGTAALHDPNLVKEACHLHPGRVAVGIDAADGFVAVEGWAELSEMKALDLALEFEDAGVAAIIYTDIDRDGVMEGLDIGAALVLAGAVSTPVIAAGGVSSMAELRELKETAEGALEGIISGRAIYDGQIDPAAAAALLRGAPS